MKNTNKLKKLATLFFAFCFLSTNAQILKAEIRAIGLTCAMCSNAINKKLKELAEVTSAETDLNTNTFIVNLKEDNKLTPKIFKEKVENAGFFIGYLIVTAKSETIDNPNYIVVDGKKNDGTTTQLQVVDKGYLTDKDFKKISKLYKNTSSIMIVNEDDFHIKILN